MEQNKTKILRRNEIKQEYYVQMKVKKQEKTNKKTK